MTDVLAIGEALIDFAPVSVDETGYPTMAAKPGGAPANFLAALTKRGLSTGLITKVGDDAFGKLLKGTLDDVGISTDGVMTDSDVFTTLAFVTLDETGDRDFSFARKPGADTCMNFDEIDTTLIDNTKVFHFGTLSLTNDPSKTATEKAIAYAKSKGKIITFDPNLRVPLWPDLEDAKKAILWGCAQADIIKISIEEVEFIFGCGEKEGAEKLLNEYGVKLAFVTLGKDGCYFANKNGTGYVKGYSVKTVDTTGAGDIFGGTAVYGVLSSGKAPEDLSAEEVTEITDVACATAALSTTKFGGILSVPNPDDVEEFRKAN
ncbi:MAG: carbohydrate kinase [Clostridia bacterium]|nr:carbohydrate kinase [Clostridia bacterium]